MANMMTYFVTRKALDGRQANGFKDINSHTLCISSLVTTNQSRFVVM